MTHTITFPDKLSDAMQQGIRLRWQSLHPAARKAALQTIEFTESANTTILKLHDSAMAPQMIDQIVAMGFDIGHLGIKQDSGRAK